ncbi:MAG TPA: hypothetical protein VH575_28205 [Gemmataceae bacterium]
MSDQFDLSQKLELRDATGHTIAIFWAQKAVQELTAERDRLRAEVAELRQMLDAARQELRDKAAIVAERDLYLRELEEFWAERIAEADKNGTDLGEFIVELERDLHARGMLDEK